jgi:acyl-CoA synthetase (AMP-forming)/AMP-acid ligase II
MYLTQGLHRAAQQQPDKVMTVQGARRRTFAQVIRRVSRLASGLRRLGVDDGDRVAMLSLNSDCYNEYLLAVPWANAVLNPVNFRWRVHEIAYCLRDSGSRVLLVDEQDAGMVPALREAVPGLETVIGVATGGLEGMVDYEELAESAAPMDDARRGGGDLAGVFYTGGTAGEPKGVMLSHANLGTSTLGTLASGCVVQPGARTLHVAPMYPTWRTFGTGCRPWSSAART